MATCKSAASRPTDFTKRGSLKGSRVFSFCGLIGTSVATTEILRFGEFGASFMRAKLAQIDARESEHPATSFQLRELSLVKEADLEIIDAEGGGMLGAHVDVSTTPFNSACISEAFTCRFMAFCTGLKS